jgi:hypothetical protein
MRAQLGIMVLIGTCAMGCRAPADPALTAAEGFLDAYYVRINLASAREYCVGLARAKLEEQIRLVGDQRIDESTRKPRIQYELKERRKEGTDRFSFVFDGRIHVDGADDFSRRWIVNTKHEGGAEWKVSNFQEFGGNED